MVQNKAHQNKLLETPSAQKTHKTPINALSIAAPLGANALESGKISRELVLAGNSGYHCNLLTSSLIRVVHTGDISKLGWLTGQQKNF
jgi:hypothetical protein